MLKAIKQALSPRTPVEEAAAAVEAARARLESVRAAQTENVSSFRMAFDATPTDELADAVAIAERRAELLIDSAAKKLDAANAELARIEGGIKQTGIAEREQIVGGLAQRIVALAAKAEPACRALHAIIRERDDMLREARLAAIELSQLRGDGEEKMHIMTTDVRMKTALLRAKLAERLTYDERQELLSLFDGLPDLGFGVPPAA